MPSHQPRPGEDAALSHPQIKVAVFALNSVNRVKQRLALAPTALLALAACTAETPPPQPAPPPASEAVDCGAGALASYVGVAASDAVIATIHQWRGNNPVRVLKPGSAMTMDFRPGRLNVFLDDQGRIEKFTCN